MNNYLKLIRIKHWLKNILLFLPLFFSMNMLNIRYLSLSFVAFLIFCLSSSIVYVINDISDVEKDRKHESKKYRPLASGAISIKNAKILLLFLILLDVILIMMNCNNKDINGIVSISLIPALYIILNILYSKWLKNIPIIDVVILVSGFLLRVIYGGILINVEVSKWLYLMIIFGSFYMGFGKRRNEILKNGTKSRKVLKLYNEEFLDKNMYVSLALAIVCYILWSVDPITISRIQSDNLFWTIPIVMVIFQLYSLNIEGNSHGDPIEVVLSDKVLLTTILIYAIVMILLIYII